MPAGSFLPSGPAGPSHTTRKPTKLQSASHHRLLGIWGSLAFHAGVCARRDATPTVSSRNDPPRATGFPSAPAHHSATFPSVSCIPHALARFFPTGCVVPPASTAVHATSAAFVSPPPALAACSHSASVGSRYRRPVFSDSHSQYFTAAWCDIVIAGYPLCPYPRSGGRYGLLGRVTASGSSPPLCPAARSASGRSSRYTNTSNSSHVTSVFPTHSGPTFTSVRFPAASATSTAPAGTGTISKLTAVPGIRSVNGSSPAGSPAPAAPANTHTPAKPARTPCNTLYAIVIRLLILLSLSLCGCSQPGRFEFTQLHMGVAARIVLYAQDEPSAASAAAAAFSRIAALDSALTDYRTDSELMRLCEAAGGPPVHVSDDLFILLQRAAAISEASDGAFDISIGPVVRLWREARATSRPPDPEALARAKSLVNHRNIILDPRRRTAQLLQPGMQLDLGGIAKGYAAQEGVKALRARGHARALVALAGDIALGDPPPGKRAWSVAIASGPSAAPAIHLANTCISTSGDAEQHIDIDGVRYSHIINPATGKGSTQKVQITTISPDGAVADALATAASLMPAEAALAITGRFPGAQIAIYTISPDMAYSQQSPGFPTPAAR